MDSSSLWLTAAPALVAGGLAAAHLARRHRRAREARAALSARPSGAPRSLHPVIDTDLCIGSLSCLKACPEGDILGIVDGAARLVHADACIGHGRCAAECPVGAIRLVFGTSERGVDLPEVDEFFETSRPGVHVVGELGGMGLIKNAVRQGLQAAERLAEVVPRGRGEVVVVGAGPAGLATALGLRAAGAPVRVLEQGSVGGAVAHYPRQKLAMTEPVELPFGARIARRHVSKEELLGIWHRAVERAGLRVEEGVRALGVDGEDGRFVVRTDRGPVPGAKVVLAIGRRGTPRRLGVPGEELEKVAYGLVDPEQYDGRRVLVVGGGDSAVEAAIALAERSTAEVTLSYRGDAFSRCRAVNRARLEALAAANRVTPLLRSAVTAVHPREVGLSVDGTGISIPNDFVLACLGGELPHEFLAGAGIALRRYHGEAPGAHGVGAHGGGARAAVARAGEARARAERRRRRAIRAAYAIAGAAVLAWLAWAGRSYYPLDRLARLRSPMHALWRPAGRIGHGIGIAATAFMLSNFLYAARKRWKRLDGLGGIRGWLDFHVFVGFMSPLVIAFHAAFQSNNLLATGTAGALAVVVTTGIVGRFIYGAVPSERGKALELEELAGRFERLKDEAGPLLAGAGPGAARLLDLATAPVRATALPVLFLRMPAESLALRLRLAALRRRLDRPAYRALRDDLVRLTRLRWQLRFYGSLRRLLRGWRVFHASLAVTLVLAIAAHIAVSLFLGYGLR